jgi:hypothetical protein
MRSQKLRSKSGLVWDDSDHEQAKGVVLGDGSAWRTWRDVVDGYPGSNRADMSGNIIYLVSVGDDGDEAAELAVVAHVRHQYTDYDDLLDNQWDREQARQQVAGEITRVLRGWEEQP